MIYVKSVMFGLAMAMVGLILWVVGSMIVGLIWLWAQTPPGAGGLGAVSASLFDVAQLVGALVLFILSSTWMYRRLRRRATRRESSL